MVRQKRRCPEETLPYPLRHSARTQVRHRSSKVTHPVPNSEERMHPVPNTPRGMSLVDVQHVRKAIFALAVDVVIIWQKTVQSKVSSLVKKDCRCIARQNVEKYRFDGRTFGSRHMR